MKQYVIPVYFSADRKLLILDFHNFVLKCLTINN